MERNIALRLMYNGTAYHGWQVQKNAVTVAETLDHRAHRPEVVGAHKLLRRPGHNGFVQVFGVKPGTIYIKWITRVTGAGRTDAGVHAETYVASFRTSSRIPLDKLPLAVNTRLPFQ